MHPAAPFAVFLLAGASALQAAAQDIDVKVERRGDLLVVDVATQVAAAPAVAWSVLTDFEHMASFARGLQTSQVLKREGNLLEVSQAGQTQWGPFTMAFELVREVELVPMSEIRSKFVKGSFKSYQSVTKMQPGSAAGSTQINHHGEYLPARWMPPMVGPGVIAEETRKQYQVLMGEVLKRAGVQPPPSPRPAP